MADDLMFGVALKSLKTLSKKLMVLLVLGSVVFLILGLATGIWIGHFIQ